MDPDKLRIIKELDLEINLRQIADQVYLSGFPSPKQFDRLTQGLGISAFVELTQNSRLRDYCGEMGLDIKAIYVCDMEDPSAYDKRQLLDYTQKMIPMGHTILIFCRGGVGRATAMGKIFLKEQGMDEELASGIAFNGLPKPKNTATSGEEPTLDVICI